MKAASLSTIAQFLCCQSLTVNFASLVGHLTRSLEEWVDHPFKISWDSETVVTFDQPGTRVLLAWSAAVQPGLAGVLTLSVGPSEMLGKPVMRPDAKRLCERLVATLADRLGPDEVLWHHIACHMSEDWVELLVEALPPRDTGQSLVANTAAAPQVANDAPAHIFIRLRDTDHAHLRAALTEETPEKLSTPMRLAVHSLNATLIVVWGPLGAAALVHGLVKGENMRRAAHLMVLSGLANAVLFSPSGQMALAMMRNL